MQSVCLRNFCALNFCVIRELLFQFPSPQNLVNSELHASVSTICHICYWSFCTVAQEWAFLKYLLDFWCLDLDWNSFLLSSTAFLLALLAVNYIVLNMDILQHSAVLVFVLHCAVKKSIWILESGEETLPYFWTQLSAFLIFGSDGWRFLVITQKNLAGRVPMALL